MSFLNGHKVSAWVATEILQIKTNEGRAKAIRKFIKVGKKMWQLFHNFNGLMEVLGALQMHPIDRLQRSWGPLLSERSVGNRTQLETLMSARMNFKTYREALADVQGPRIPFLALLLKDFTLCCEGNAKYDASGRVNVDRLKLIGKQIVSVQRVQAGCRYSTGHNSNKEDTSLMLVTESEEELMRLSDRYHSPERESTGGSGGPMASLASFLSSSSEIRRRQHSPTHSLSSSSSAILSTPPSASSSSTSSPTTTTTPATTATSFVSPEQRMWKGFLAIISPRKKGEGEDLEEEGEALRKGGGTNTSPRSRDTIMNRIRDKSATMVIKKSLSADDASFNNKIDSPPSAKEKRMSLPFKGLQDLVWKVRDVEPLPSPPSQGSEKKEQEGRAGAGREAADEEVEEKEEGESIEDKRETEEETVVERDSISPRQQEEQPPSPHLESTAEDRVSPMKKKKQDAITPTTPTRRKRTNNNHHPHWEQKMGEKEREKGSPRKGNERRKGKGKGNGREKGKGRGKGEGGRGTPSSSSSSPSSARGEAASSQKKKKEIVLLTKRSRSEGALDDLKKLHQAWKANKGKKEASPRNDNNNSDVIDGGGAK